MIKRIFKKERKALVILAYSIAFFTILCGAIFAAVMMNGVPQKIGMTDVKFENLDKKVCIGCHGDSLVDKHHETQKAVAGECTSCHSVSTKDGKTGVRLTRNCMSCHKSSPHHATADAVNKKCTACHDSQGVSQFSTATPSYKPSKVTPGVNACKNCHIDATVDGKKVLGFKETHHGIGLKPCETCHTDKKDSDDIRICERCHSVAALHGVAPHMSKENCVGCHVVAAAKQEPPKK